MQAEIYNLLQNRPDLKHVVRNDPRWYRELTRDPGNIEALKTSAKYFYGKTWTQKLKNVTQKADMLNMLLSMATLTDD